IHPSIILLYSSFPIHGIKDYVVSGFTILIGFLLLWIWGYPKSKGYLPPGLRPLPFLGNILQIDPKSFLKSFEMLQEKYGDIFTLMWEALVDHAETFFGVTFTNGKTSKVLHRFCVTTLKDLGMGKWSIEEQIKEEAQCLVEQLWKSQGAYLDPTLLFHSMMANIMCSIIFGEWFTYQDPKFLQLINILKDCSDILSSFYSWVFELLLGILKFFPGPHTQIYRNSEELAGFIVESIEKYQQTLDLSAPRDFIDSFLIRMDKEKFVRESEFYHKNFIHTVLSLFFAGTETSSTTLSFALLILLKHLVVLEKVQVEIDRVIGQYYLPALEDQVKMPFTDAVIHEIQRYSDLVPIGIPHCVIQDIHFREYFIPKDTTIYPVMSSVRDPHYFQKPNIFYPGHFLNAEGNFRKLEAFIPFSMGKRMCLGESLARAELFLFLTTTLQTFSLGCPKVPEDIDLTARVTGLGKLPPCVQLCFLPHW
uniref:Uncharacterized protein n=1 Tax=Castor canadensis TaxID=51338 RepID=A0A8C0WRK2_CASCN